RAWAAVRRAAMEHRPRVALLVDAPDFNLPLARALAAQGTRVVFYVGPQVWAWRAGRLGLLAKRTDVVALVLPFELPLYERAGVKASFVGHPLLDEPAAAPSAATRASLGMGADDTIVALLPGSRRAEVKLLGGPVIAAARELAKRGLHPVFSPGPGAADKGMFEAAHDAGCGVLPGRLATRDLLAAADVALVASGTATLEAALAGVPTAVAYRMDPVSWAAARLLVRTSFVALPNLVAGRRVVPELLQGEATGPSLAKAALGLLNPWERKRQQEGFAKVRGLLGGPGAASRVWRLVEERLT
ncbi:MAG: lipid-A-disaccharide synthase, partial [Deltaproteobacteria bacterium]|nr:lipid-A-disaccharide synthase [Deltaproteobacteria bacterium]